MKVEKTQAAKRKPNRHPDLLTSGEAGERMCAPSNRLDMVPLEFRPKPLPYNSHFYHREAVDEAIQRASRQANPILKLRNAS